MKIKVRTKGELFEGNDWVDAGMRWTCELMDYPMKIKGCPVGRSTTKEGAIKDLVRRISYESNVTIEPFEGETTWRSQK